MSNEILPELKPCPCCGGTAKFTTAKSDIFCTEGIAVRCSMCSIGTGGAWGMNPHAQVAAVWNQRLDPEVEDTVASLMDDVEEFLKNNEQQTVCTGSRKHADVIEREIKRRGLKLLLKSRFDGIFTFLVAKP